MRRWRYLVLLVWIGFPALVNADNLTVDDFAYGLRINVPKGTAVAAISLPEAVYKSASRTDLGDVRVFNGNGEPVPHLLRYARSQSVEAPWQPLPFFLLPDGPNTETSDYSVHVRTGPDGTVVRINPQTQPTSEKPERTVLIDLSRMDVRLAALRLEWQPGTMNRMVFLTVEKSDDLVHWKRLSSQAVISDIHYGGHRLRNNTIALLPDRQRYLRLRQLDAGPAIALTAIEGRPQPEGHNPVRTFLKIDGRRLPDANGVYEYDTGGAFPVDRVNLLFDQPNCMADAQLASRNVPRGEWSRRYKGLFYRIDIERTPMTSVPQPVAVAMDRYWRLTVDASDSTIGRSIPRLEIGYRPHDLYFIARGGGPFTLAFGSTRAAPLKTNVAALVDRINQSHENGIQRWVFPQGAAFELGGVQRLAPPSPPLPTRRIVLWSVLLAGVLIVAAMAWRLARRLKP
jgi:hypothetical protein